MSKTGCVIRRRLHQVQLGHQDALDEVLGTLMCMNGECQGALLPHNERGQSRQDGLAQRCHRTQTSGLLEQVIDAEGSS